MSHALKDLSYTDIKMKEIQQNASVMQDNE